MNCGRCQTFRWNRARQQDYWNFGNNFNNRRSNTNVVVAETDMGGVHLKLFTAKRFTDQQMGNGEIGGGVHIQATPSLPAGMQMTLVKVTDNQGRGNSKQRLWHVRQRHVHHLRLSVARHRRPDQSQPHRCAAQKPLVEFTVKPEKEKP